MFRKHLKQHSHTHTHTHYRMHTCMRRHITQYSTHTYACADTHYSAHTLQRTHTHACTKHTHTHTQTHTHAQTHTTTRTLHHTHTHTHTHYSAQTCMRRHTHYSTHPHKCTHAHTHTHTHTHMHRHTLQHTHTQKIYEQSINIACCYIFLSALLKSRYGWMEMVSMPVRVLVHNVERSVSCDVPEFQQRSEQRRRRCRHIRGERSPFTSTISQIHLSIYTCFIFHLHFAGCQSRPWRKARYPKAMINISCMMK